MISGILGKKIGTTQIFKKGKCIPVTVLEVGPCTVLQVKTQEKDGYCAVQLGFEDKRAKSATKPEIGHAKKHASAEPKKFIREVPWDGKDEVKPGDKVSLEFLKKMRYIDITGTTKGKGFQGGVKRHGFKGGPTTHGQSDRLRAPGSISSNTDPAHVLKGKRMAGHMGNVRCTTRNLEVVDVNEEQNILTVRGSVPGHNNGYVIIRKGLGS